MPQEVIQKILDDLNLIGVNMNRIKNVNKQTCNESLSYDNLGRQG